MLEVSLRRFTQRGTKAPFFMKKSEHRQTLTDERFRRYLIYCCLFSRLDQQEASFSEHSFFHTFHSQTMDMILLRTALILPLL